MARISTPAGIREIGQTPLAERELSPMKPLTSIGKIFKPILTYWEIESAYKQAISQTPNLSAIHIRVGPDNVHGTLAQVQVRAGEGNKAPRIEAEINRILGDFTVKYELEVRE
ncbi:MAG: hypothetical protein AAF804_02980 [Bacteroidota bacterium]